MLFLNLKAKEFLWVCISTVINNTMAINMLEKPKNVNSDFSFFQVQELYSLYSVEDTTKYYVYSFIKIIFILLSVLFMNVSSFVSYWTCEDK